MSADAPPQDEISAFLKSKKVTDIEGNNKDVVEVLSTMKPAEAARILWKNNIIGAPVWDEKTQKYVGIFDMRDMLSTVIASFKEEDTKAQKSKDDWLYTTKWFANEDKIQDWYIKAYKKKEDPVKVRSDPASFNVSYIAARNPFVSLTDDATVLNACDMVSQRFCHRVPIVDKTTGRCVRIISQSGLVRFLAEHLLKDNKSAQVKKLFDQTLEESMFPYKKKVVSAPETATAREVFELMDSERLSGIAIVDSSGALVANTSATDIKLAVAVDSDDAVLANLAMNIISYLSAIRQQECPTKEARHPSSCVRESSTFGHAVRLLAATGYHRVFVVDKDRKPIGVVSVSDIIKLITIIAE